MLLMLVGGEKAMAQFEHFDLYIVPHRGDTIREGIQKIFFHHGRRGHLAWVKYKDGTKRRYSSTDLKAFSFVDSGGWFLWWRLNNTYHQVQVLKLNDKKKNTTPHFYEPIASCNGHTLYLDFGWDDDSPLRLLMATGNILKYEFRYKKKPTRDYLMQHMPDCMREIDERLWPKWAKNNYEKVAPKKPVY